MVLPGVPGNSILIIMGIYDSILIYLKELYISKLLIFALGGVLGIVFLLKLLERIYENNRKSISYFFVGLILASTKMLIPSYFNLLIVITFISGFSLVWIWNKH